MHDILHVLALSRLQSWENHTQGKMYKNTMRVTTLEYAAGVCIKHSSKLNIYSMNID
jgi:hypothetical protein